MESYCENHISIKKNDIDNIIYNKLSIIHNY